MGPKLNWHRGGVRLSPRALSLTIKQGMATGLVTRRLLDGFPPVPLYARSERGERLAAAIAG